MVRKVEIYLHFLGCNIANTICKPDVLIDLQHQNDPQKALGGKGVMKGRRQEKGNAKPSQAGLCQMR